MHQFHSIFVYKLMQCLHQVAVLVGISIAAYDCGRPCEIWPDPKGEGVTLFRTGTQTQPSLPKSLAPTGRFEAAFFTLIACRTQDN